MTEALEAVAHTAALDLAGELQAAERYALAGLSAATLRAYASDWRAFTAWCGPRALEPLPAAPQTVAVFLADQAGTRALRPATVARRAAAIAYRHRLEQLANPVDTEVARAVLKGIRRHHGIAPARKDPLRRSPLAEVLAATAADTPTGLRDRALLLTGFAGALRRSELVAIDLEHLDFTTDRGVLVSLPTSKTDQEGAGDTIPIHRSRDPALCPVRALRAWLDAAAITHGPVFRRMNRGQHLGGRLSAQSVALIIKRHARAAGLEPAKLAGHSLRAGYATTAAAQGLQERQIARVTRHKNLTVLRGYIRPETAFEDSQPVL